jgi:hypothetical protein
MRVSVVRGGGIAGLTSRTSLSSEALAPADAKALELRLRDAGLLGRRRAAPAPAEKPPRGADQMLYAVTVDDGEEEWTGRFSDETIPDRVRELIEWVDARPESQHEVGR